MPLAVAWPTYAVVLAFTLARSPFTTGPWWLVATGLLLVLWMVNVLLLTLRLYGASIFGRHSGFRGAVAVSLGWWAGLLLPTLAVVWIGRLMIPPVF